MSKLKFAKPNKPELHVVSLSGGKDSTAMLLRMIEEGMRIDLIMFCDTGLEFPALYRHLDKLQKEIGMPIVRISADHTFEHYMLNYEVREKKQESHTHHRGLGWPGPMYRWCTREFKERPRQKYLRPLQAKYQVIEYVGLAADEGFCWEIHSKAKDILEGRKNDPTFYPVIYGIGDNDDWTDEANWYKANPSLDITVDVEKLRAAYNSAKDNPAEENLFRQLRLNQWVKQSVRWMPMDAWDKCDAPVDPETLIGRECYAGLDLSSSTDITAFVLVFPPEDPEGRYVILPYFWVPEETLDLRVRRDHVPYDVWKKQGSILTTEGNVIHYNFIESFIEDLGEKYNIKEIAYDRWGAVQMSQNLDDDGFTIVPFGQGFKDMSPPTKELMKLVLEGRIAHGGNAPLRWMMDNIFIRTDPAGNIKPDKEKSTERIDGAVATIMALDRAIRHQGTGSSVYDQRGLLFI